MLEKLTKSELTDIIGEDLYQDISSFLENVLDEDEGLKVYQKQNIIRLLLSLSEKKSLKKPRFWRDLSGRLTDDERSAMEENGVNFGLDDRSFANACLSREYEKYSIEVVEKQSELKVRQSITLCSAPDRTFKFLKDYQFGTYLEAMEELEISRSRFIVQMPTGSGKTRTAMEVVTKQLNSETSKKNVIWLAHSVDLVEQAAASFEEVWEHIGLKDAVIRLLDGSRNGIAQETEQETSFIVATLQSLTSYQQNRPKEFENLASSVSLVVVDEAHISLAPTYNTLVKGLVAKGASLMGLTATPGRGAASSEQNKELADFYFNRIIGLSIPEGFTVFEYLRSIGTMSSTKMEHISGTEVVLSRRDAEKISDSLSIPKHILTKLAKEEMRNIEIIGKLKILFNENPERKVILFACGVDHSKFIVSVCTYLGIKAAHIDGGTSASQRRHLIDSFRNGELQLLSNYGVLSTGFDAPKTDVVFIARPTASIVLYSQMIGRGLRGPNIGGTRNCLIVNVKDNISGLPNPDEIYDYFSDYYIS